MFWLDSQAKGLTALTLAAKKGDEECLRVLLDGGANVEAKDLVRNACWLIYLSMKCSVIFGLFEA